MTQERLKELLSYNPESGLFTWKVTRGRAQKGSVAGSLNNEGYRRVTLDGESYKAHRLAFLYMEGSFPPDYVDHINRVRDDNRWENLRTATNLENNNNKANNNDFIGVLYHKRLEKWQAYTQRVEGVCRHIGYFNTHIAACYARHANSISN